MGTRWNKRVLLVGVGIPLGYQILFTIFAYSIPITLVPPWGWLMLHFLTDTLFIGCPLIAIGLPLKTAWKIVGGWGVGWIDGTIAVAGGGLLVFLIQVSYNVILSLIFHVSSDFGLSQSSKDVIPLIIWIALIGPLGEEVYYRGFLNYIFPKAWQFIIFSSLLWSGLHVDIVSFLPLLLTGIILAVTRVKTHSFYPAVTIHILINIGALCFYFFVQK